MGDKRSGFSLVTVAFVKCWIIAIEQRLACHLAAGYVPTCEVSHSH